MQEEKRPVLRLKPSTVPDGAPNGVPEGRAGQTGGNAQAFSGGQVLKTSDLFGGGREVTIDHHGDFYRLRETSKGRLILTK